MNKLPRPLPAAACLLAAASLVPAQQPAKKPAPGDAAAARAAAADPVAANRRATAVNLLNALADEARGFQDPNLRARVQAQSADALWDTDKERARTLFRRAWDAAEQADAENTRRRDAERRLPQTGAPGGGGGRTTEEVRGQGGGPARPGGLATRLNLPQMRSEVLRLAARRERALGEEFLSKMEEARKQEEKDLSAASVAGSATDAAAASSSSGSGAATPTRRNPHEAPPDEARRLQLAMQFLAENDAERALQFADSALRSVNPTVVEFLVTLRDKNAEAADQRFSALLGMAANDPATNANAVLILSSYVLTPGLYMTLAQGGINTSQRRRDITTPDLPAPVRTGFAQFAAQVLLRPLPPPEQDPQGLARSGVYFVISRLLPFFEQALPERAPALRAQVAAITPDVPEQRRNEWADDVKQGLVPDGQRDGERLQNTLDAAAGLSDPAARDRAYAQAAMIASRLNDSKARDYAAKIEDPALRQQVRAFIDFAAINAAIQSRDGMEVLRATQTGEVTPTQRAWGYSEAARLLTKDDRPRALEALEWAFEAARKIDAEDPDRPRALVGVATQYAALDRNRAWELMSEVVKAANASAEFTGSDAGLAARVQMRNSTSTMNFSAPTFNLAGVFQLLARDDMNRAVALAREFTHEGPRAAATLAAARAVLDDKPAEQPRPNRAER